ncbi:hypothetical protein LCGC14_1146540 [marine sediment metagenome]|uniref:Uncharacterized protein n=1 Tax=marine sediment metagenome TaxID=412755 RepID=A0A0F9PEU9_9ZZZZ
MIESEEKKKRLNDTITHWCKHTKVDHLLRNGDIQWLVGSILSEFYCVTLCCGHKVKGNEGVHIAFNDFVVDRGDSEHGGGMGEVSGIYCDDCAEHYKKEIGAWEI